MKTETKTITGRDLFRLTHRETFRRSMWQNPPYSLRDALLEPMEYDNGSNKKATVEFIHEETIVYRDGVTRRFVLSALVKSSDRYGVLDAWTVRLKRDDRPVTLVKPTDWNFYGFGEYRRLDVYENGVLVRMAWFSHYQSVVIWLNYYFGRRVAYKNFPNVYKYVNVRYTDSVHRYNGGEISFYPRNDMFILEKDLQKDLQYVKVEYGYDGGTLTYLDA